MPRNSEEITYTIDNFEKYNMSKSGKINSFNWIRVQVRIMSDYKIYSLPSSAKLVYLVMLFYFGEHTNTRASSKKKQVRTNLDKVDSSSDGLVSSNDGVVSSNDGVVSSSCGVVTASYRLLTDLCGLRVAVVRRAVFQLEQNQLLRTYSEVKKTLYNTIQYNTEQNNTEQDNTTHLKRKSKPSKKKRSAKKKPPKQTTMDVLRPPEAQPSKLHWTMDLWNKHVPEDLSPVKSYNSDRKRWIAKLLKEFPDESTWMEVIEEIKTTPFLLGHGQKGWRCNFDWLIRNPTNFTKVLEGTYKDSKNKTLPMTKADIISAKNKALMEKYRGINNAKMRDVN